MPLPTLKPGQPHPALVQAVTRLLRPLVKLLVANGVTYPYLANLLKGLYVHVATEEFAIADKTPTDSRVSLLTGVHRKEVRRLRSDTARSAPLPESVSLGTQIVARWLGEAEFSSSTGKPKRLPRSKVRGDPSFESLVEQVSRRDLRARSVLDELERLGIVALVEDDHVQLNVEGFVPDSGFEEKAYYFGRILATHIDTAAHNLGAAGRPYLDRAVFYDGLLEKDVAKLERMCRGFGIEALKAVNREAIKMKRRAAKSTDDKQRICFGVFYQAGPSERGGNGEEGENS